MTRHDYLPFGEELFAGPGGRTTAQGYVGDNVRQKFTSYQRDNETGLDFAEARYYSSTQGRFTRPDPYNIIFGMNVGRNARERAQVRGSYMFQPQNWNRYTYCLNNPTNLYDPSGLIWVHDNEKDLYIFVKDEDYQKGNEYYDNRDRYRPAADGPDGETFVLGELTGSANTAENQALMGQRVYLGSDGHIHPVDQVNSPPTFLDTLDIPVDVFGNSVFQAGGSVSTGGGSISYVPKTGVFYGTFAANTPGPPGGFIGGGSTNNLDQSGPTVGVQGFYFVGGGISGNPLTGDYTTLFGLGSPGASASGGYTWRLCSVPPGIVHVRTYPIHEPFAMPLGDGLYGVNLQRAFGGP